MGNPHRSSEMSGLRFPSLAEVFEACALLEAAYQHSTEHVFAPYSSNSAFWEL
jgi:hypothetical protein